MLLKYKFKFKKKIKRFKNYKRTKGTTKIIIKQMLILTFNTFAL